MVQLTDLEAEESMKGLCILVSAVVLGWVGWWLGGAFSLMTRYLLSSVASMAGVYVGWRIYREYLH